MATGCTVVVCRYLAVASWRLSQVQISTERRSIATAASDAGAACAPPASTSPRPWHTHPRALTAFLHINPGHPDYLFTAPRSSFVLSYICFRHITFRSPILRKGPPIRLQSMFVLLFFYITTSSFCMHLNFLASFILLAEIVLRFSGMRKRGMINRKWMTYV